MLTRFQLALDCKLSIACDMLHVKLSLGHVALGLKVEAKINYRDRTGTTSYEVLRQREEKPSSLGFNMSK